MYITVLINLCDFSYYLYLYSIYQLFSRSCVLFSFDVSGKRIFQEALLEGHMETYFVLASQFSTQEEPAFCGLTTLVMILNALEVDPKQIWKSPWRWYHEQMLDCCVPMEVSDFQVTQLVEKF